MDEEIIEEVAPIDAAEGAHLQGKEVEYLVKPDNCNVLVSQEMVIPVEVNASFRVLGDVLEGKNVLEHGCTSPCTYNDENDIVEELTLRNYNGSNIPVVGTSNDREKAQMRQNHWQHLYQLASGSGSGGSCSKMDNSQAMPSMPLDARCASFPEILGHKPLSDGQTEAAAQLIGGENNEVSGSQQSHGGIKTKILSKSGFSEFFVKTTLKGKGIICRGPSHDASRVHLRHRNNTKSTGQTMVAPIPPVKAAGSPVVASNTSLILDNRAFVTSPNGIIVPRAGERDHDGINLREWLKVLSHKANKAECLYIFRQIVDLVDYSHSQGAILHDLRPSCFKLLQANQVKYIGSGVQKGLLDTMLDKDSSPSENFMTRRRPMKQGMISSIGLCAKKQKINENTNLTRWPLFHSRANLKNETINTQFSHNESSEHCPNTQFSNFGSSHSSNSAQHQSVTVNEQLEEKWYASPEEINEVWVCCFLRLLHPEPSLRPTTRDILQSEVLHGFQEVFAEELSSSINQDDTESELLLHFLGLSKEQKQKHASKLMEDIACLEADIKEVEKRRHFSRKPLTYSSINARECRHHSKKPPISEMHSSLYPFSSDNEMRLMRNINQLESAYFSMRSRVPFHETDSMRRPDKDLLKNRDNGHLAQNNEEMLSPPDSLGAFFDGLCKYARYSKFEVRGIMRSGEFNNSANVICSLSFDRDEDYFAAAGVSKKIKIFEFNALFNDSVDIHYPVIEMLNKSKLSCVCWNNYIKNYLASTDYDGLVKVCTSFQTCRFSSLRNQLWDASTGQAISHYIEHEKRAWSVDFSQVYPTKLASGSDDCSVKLWSINEKNCLGTIRNIANVCCVQFSAHSPHLLAFGSADYKTYCYDLRNARAPWCVLDGHDKAVSYVKFLDSETVVTASTDNTLKLWDLNKTSSGGLSSNACSLTFCGHTNEKVGISLLENSLLSLIFLTLASLFVHLGLVLMFYLLLQNFVGLSVVDGFIACGSETNEVYAYYRSLPMPITSHKFGSIDPISGKDTDDDNGLFVSSVCWRGKSDMVVAANSSGCIKVLQMV
ncbi:protein SPA1-RELATED 2 isoform X1 [Gossypium australe]|uniref:Protein SPA1-RELATED 2 isoform X1 n=1 Tax=Gossypium australe TaxID=47621 RepID=A0A5B6UTP0_9ROSI|nr:protein SPA1-RELATED 2 isoform X1 [Gossypium australe]